MCYIEDLLLYRPISSHQSTLVTARTCHTEINFPCQAYQTENSVFRYTIYSHTHTRTPVVLYSGENSTPLYHEHLEDIRKMGVIIYSCLRQPVLNFSLFNLYDHLSAPDTGDIVQSKG